ncbi:DUF4365 domain-containing protein, partial [Mesorhizobium sp. M7A.F.Ca.US.001.01.1.1]
MAKKLSDQQVIGKRGALVFSELVLAHGLSFHETNALDTGIDGYIELRDPITKEVRAQHIATQIKTQSEGNFPEETAETFSFTCEQKDLDYWMEANTPVILVVVRLSDKGVFWKSVRTWFDDPERRRKRKVVFNKRSDALNAGSLAEFGALIASFARPGLMIPAMRSEEMLDTNLLKVFYPDKVHVAMTSLSYSEIRSALKEAYGSVP